MRCCAVSMSPATTPGSIVAICRTIAAPVPLRVVRVRRRSEMSFAVDVCMSGSYAQKREQIQRGRNREDVAGRAGPGQNSIAGRPGHGGELVESVALFLPLLEIPVLHEQLGRALFADDPI